MSFKDIRFNNEVKRLDMPIETDGEIELIDITNKDGMRVYRRGLIYIISKAFNELYPEVSLSVSFQLSNSMYCISENMAL